MAKTNYPLNVLHGYVADAKSMVDFCQDLQKVDLDTLPAISEISKERRPLIAYGALVLEQLLRMSGAARLQVSTSGVREGMLHSLLPPELQAEDPLIVGARAPRISMRATPPMRMISSPGPMSLPAPPFPMTRARTVASVTRLPDLGSRLARQPGLPGRGSQPHDRLCGTGAISHRERAFLASVQHARYEGLTENVTPPLRGLLSLREIESARALGCLIRVAYNISAGQRGILPKTPIRVENGGSCSSCPRLCQSEQRAADRTPETDRQGAESRL